MAGAVAASAGRCSTHCSTPRRGPAAAARVNVLSVCAARSPAAASAKEYCSVATPLLCYRAAVHVAAAAAEAEIADARVAAAAAAKAAADDRLFRSRGTVQRMHTAALEGATAAATPVGHDIAFAATAGEGSLPTLAAAKAADHAKGDATNTAAPAALPAHWLTMASAYEHLADTFLLEHAHLESGRRGECCADAAHAVLHEAAPPAFGRERSQAAAAAAAVAGET
ncbi:antifreeze protein Maxi-like [Cyclospora cayetanensis]|uniref:Antifreeze protein Maxi-like n=1 Tax=Cyclospora cayetanensis TaxID=88456 RepID=A0A6P6S069_9EIME|nr:antifreeze protein Maxi-like [Cyclospora cayetanensis]